MMRRVFLSLVLLMPALGFAHGDEDHGAGAATAVIAEALPRAEAQTELFELVAVPQGEQLTIYLDDTNTNQPVTDARIEVESGSWKAVAEAGEGATYRVAAPQLATAGSYPLVFTVTAGDAADLLETTLVVKPIAPAASPAGSSSRLSWKWLAGALGAVALGMAWLTRRRKSAAQG